MVVGEPKRSIMEGIENTGDVRLHDHRLRLRQRFDIIRKLGQGTYGKVQLGINKKTGQEVAIKTIKKCKIETEADLVRIRREVQIMSSVRHPNIVHIYEVFENSEKMILVMEYCAGGELYDYLSQQKVLQEDEARRLFRQIATAVYYCHKHKICHRDLKLENVLLDEHGSAKIADFGLSNVFEEKRLLSTFCGSPLYASPEIVKGTPYIGPEVDCWSLGVLLYTLVYGAMPFDGSNFKRLVKQISTGDYFEPKNPSSASPLIREMLTVDPIQRADIPHICDHPWVNKGSDISCLDLAESLANETPVRLDLLLSLAPPPAIGSDKLVVTDEVSQIGPDGSPARSMSVANIDNSAERRILEMVAEGGADAIKPSPTRTIINNEQPKRKLETTVSMDNAAGQRKKERIVRSSSGSRQTLIPDDSEVSITPYVESNNESVNDISMMSSQNDLPVGESLTSELTIPSQKEPPVAQPKASSPTVTKNLSQLTLVIPNETPATVQKPSPEKVVANNQNKEVKAEQKTKEVAKIEKTTTPKPTVVRKKPVSPVKKDEKVNKVEPAMEKSPPRKSIEKDITGRVIASDKKAEKKEEVAKHDVSPTKESSPTKQAERRKSRIMDAAEKLNNLTIQPTQPSPEQTTQNSPPTAKPKKVLIPGVSVGSFKEQFERRASLTSGNIPVPSNDTRKPIAKAPLGTANNVTVNKPVVKKIHSVDSEHPQTATLSQTKEPNNVKLETIGVEPTKQVKEESPRPVVEPKKPAIVEVHKVPKILHKSESMRENSKPEPVSNSMSLEDARRSLQQSMALLSQAKSESKSNNDFANENQNERQKQLRAAREIISNAIGEDGKKVQRGKPPVPYGSGGRSSSGTISLHSLSSLPGSPPTSPPNPRLIRESPARTFRTEVQHRVDDVRNKYLPNSRGGSVERIIPIHFADEAPPKPPSLNHAPPTQHQLPYQRNNSMPFRLNSLPRGMVSDFESSSSQPSTPSSIANNSRAEPIKKSPREFIIPIAVEGKGYVTPRQGSLEPSDIPSKMAPSNVGFASRFPKPRRISSLVSGGESEDEDDLHMHRLRSSRRARADAEKDSVSSGEEDDDEGFELLTAENLFSTLLDRVRTLTNRLNGEEGTGFPQHHQSLFNNLHSPFFNSPHLPRKHKRQNLIRDGPSWRRSTSRDVTSDFDSMFPSHPTFPRGSKKSRKATTSSKSSSQKSAELQQTASDLDSTNKNPKGSEEEDESHESLDLSDLDLSKIELSEKDVETLSGLTPALSRRLQKQLLEHLPPAAARSLRRTLSMNYPAYKKTQHKYTRSSSASKTANRDSSFVEEEDGEKVCERQVHNNGSRKISDDVTSSVRRNKYRYSTLDDDDSSSVSTTLSRTEKENRTISHNSYLKHDASVNSIDSDFHSPGDTPTPQRTLLSSVRSTPDKSVLRKYFAEDKNAYDVNKNRSNIETNYLCGFINSISNECDNAESIVRRRSLKSSAESAPRRRISRFLRPDFFDTPREESIYVRDKLDKESETQKVLKEIREKRNNSRSGAVSPNLYVSDGSFSDMLLSPSLNSKSFVTSPISPVTPNRSRSVTPFYPILDNINEIQNIGGVKDTYVPLNGVQSVERKSEAIIKNTSLSPSPEGNNESYSSQKIGQQDNLKTVETQDAVPANKTVAEDNNINNNCDCNGVIIDTNGNNSCVSRESSVEKNLKQKESKIARPRSYPISTQSIEKKLADIPINETTNVKSQENISRTEESNIIINKPSEPDNNNGDITVSFNINLPPKSSKVIKVDEQPSNNSNATEAKKAPTKKKIIVKKVKSSSKAAAASKLQKENSEKIGNDLSPTTEDAAGKKANKESETCKPVVAKKKSVFQSIGQKFEKLRNESFSKGNSQEKETPTQEGAAKKTRIAREHSVPIETETEPTTESGLIKRAVTITSLPTLEAQHDSTSKKSVNRVLGLFKKLDSKDKANKSQSSEISNDENESSVANVDIAKTISAKSDQLVECKPRRPTSLLLNGIGKRVQSCYGGASSDGALTKKDKKPVENSNAENDGKNAKKGLRLDFSKLPKLNQNIFNKRNSVDLAKNGESVDANSNLAEDEEGIATSNQNGSIASESLPRSESNGNNNNNNSKTYDNDDRSVCSNGNLASPQVVVDWSPDFNNRTCEESLVVESENASPESENIIDRIRRKSFYSRFNEKKNRRKSLLVGPGAKEYIPSARINPQCENADDFSYSPGNKYDLSPTSPPSKYNLNYDYPHHRHSHSESLSSSPLRVSNDPFHLYSDQSRYSDGLGEHHSVPRYQRTLSYFGDAKNGTTMGGGESSRASSSSRYGRTLSLLSPGIYATYSPRSHTRNSAILLRDSLDSDVTSEDILAKIRNRKKAAAAAHQSSSGLDASLDSKLRSNHTHNSDNDTPINKTE